MPKFNETCFRDFLKSSKIPQLFYIFTIFPYLSHEGGEAGEATRARGFLSYYEICERIQKHGWHVVRDKKGRMGPYAYLKDQWVSFDDALMIRHKSEFVKSMKLGGAMIWALDLDDFKNYCNCEEYPLLRTINRVLRNYPGAHPKCPLERQPEGKQMQICCLCETIPFGFE